MQLLIFTDGSSINNGKKNCFAGYGIHFPNKEFPDVSRIFTHKPITNQRAELYAIYKAIKMIEGVIGDYDEIIIYSDSEYSIKSVTIWVKKWVTKNWMLSKNKPVKNVDIIKPLYELLLKYPIIKLEHVRSHTGKKDFKSLGNEKADVLATEASEKAKMNGVC
jgi:ribonuclease HI